MGNGFVGLVSRRGKSLRRLAETLGVSHSLLSQVGTGRRTLTPEMLDRVAEALAVERTEVLAHLGGRDGNGRADVQALRVAYIDDVPAVASAIEVVANISAAGDLTLERRYLGCLPRPGRDEGSLTIQARILGKSPAKPDSSIELFPGLAKLTTETRIDEPWQIHKIRFGRTDGGVAVLVRDRLAGAYASGALDPAALRVSKWSRLTFYLPIYSDRLVFDVALGETPTAWRAFYWLGSNSMDDEAKRLEPGARCCASFSLDEGPGRARLVVERPLTCYSFSMAWWSIAAGPLEKA